MKILLILLLLLLPLPTLGLTKTEKEVLDDINKVRIEHHLNPVSPLPELNESASLKATYMGKYHFFNHNWNGLSWLWWIRKSFKGEAGENLSYTLPPKMAITEWMKSPLHRENILYPDWKYIGIRAQVVEAPLPTIPGPNRVMIVTHFGD